MIKRYALITAGTVTNIVEQAASPPSVLNPVESVIAKIGDTYDGVTFASPVIPPQPEQTKDAAIAAIKGRINALEQSQSRAVREALLGGPTDRLAALDARIAALRAEMAKA